jgi:type IX secretion system PorP/SprF family membrane protein
MNRFIISILAALISLQLSGQMFPISDNYVNNGLVINPAFAGSHEALSATISYRNQWEGFKDAPRSQMLSVHTPLFNDRVGLGLVVAKNSLGIFKETSFIGNYSYRMELQNGKLALGLGFGLTSYRVAWNELDATDPDDVQLMNTQGSAVLPSFSLGTYYYTRKYFIGISMPLFLSHELDKSTGKYKSSFSLSKSNYFLTGGYEVSISPSVKIIPSILIKYHPNNALQMDYNAQVILKDRIWMGIGYRNKDMLIGMLQYQLSYQIRVAYSYDYDLGTLGRYMNGSHEVQLNYVFRFERNVIGPRHF